MIDALFIFAKRKRVGAVLTRPDAVALLLGNKSKGPITYSIIL